jgi:hypothetical protein
LFLEKGCPQCHSITALGVKSATEVGPDLTLAYSDVKNRFNVSLEEFFHNPTGTMQIVLSQQITLSPAERIPLSTSSRGFTKCVKARRTLVLVQGDLNDIATVAGVAAIGVVACTPSKHPPVGTTRSSPTCSRPPNAPSWPRQTRRLLPLL